MVHDANFLNAWTTPSNSQNVPSRPPPLFYVSLFAEIWADFSQDNGGSVLM
jgi:hypothetical protein